MNWLLRLLACAQPKEPPLAEDAFAKLDKAKESASEKFVGFFCFVLFCFYLHKSLVTGGVTMLLIVWMLISSFGDLRNVKCTGESMQHLPGPCMAVHLALMK